MQAQRIHEMHRAGPSYPTFGKGPWHTQNLHSEIENEDNGWSQTCKPLVLVDEVSFRQPPCNAWLFDQVKKLFWGDEVPAWGLKGSCWSTRKHGLMFGCSHPNPWSHHVLVVVGNPSRRQLIPQHYPYKPLQLNPIHNIVSRPEEQSWFSRAIPIWPSAALGAFWKFHGCWVGDTWLRKLIHVCNQSTSRL